MTQLRFAPIVRVSTEKQKQKGESLLTQKTQIIRNVELLHGVIPNDCWKYCGQEHATPNQERALLDKLLSDSSTGLFDAVIVTDASRWSRDKKRALEDQEILRSNGIRFYVGLTEYDLNNADQEFMLGISTAMNQLHATKQTENSIANRIHRARRGIPATGKLPYGRTYSEKKGWSLDRDKLEIIEKVAQRYLNGESMIEIARSVGMDPSHLHKILTKRCGTQWKIRFRYKQVDETIKMTIPRLLSDAKIAAIKERLRVNKTYTRGNKKHEYLLTGMVYCQKCGYSLLSYCNATQTRYYRHSQYGKCEFHKFVPATELENSMLLLLVQTFGDPEMIQRAIERAIPDIDRREALDNELVDLESKLRSIVNRKNHLVEKVDNGLLTDSEIEFQMGKLRIQETDHQNRINQIKGVLNTIPKPKDVRRFSKWAYKVISDATKENPKLIFKRSFAWKRKLVEKVFGGLDASGQHLGVYVDWVDNHFVFEIRGTLINTARGLPMTDEELWDIFNWDSEYQDVDQELKKIREQMVSNGGSIG